MDRKLEEDAIARLYQINEYRQFILEYKKQRSFIRKLSFANIARNAGFKSASFPRDVATEKKKVSLSSLYPMIQGLGLTGALKDYFICLVYLEHPELTVPPAPSLEVRDRIRNIRSRALKKKNIDVKFDPYQSHFFPYVYSALGPLDLGASIEEIHHRTQIPMLELERVISQLCEIGIIYKKRDRFFSKENHLVLSGLEESQAFQKHFNFLLGQASKKSQKQFKCDDALFFSSCFSVDRKKMPELKAELRDVLLRFVDRSENPSGNYVGSIVCSLF